MEQYIKLFDLNEDQARAVERFREYHRSCEAHAGGGKASNRPLEWHLGYEDRSLELACCCGATLHLTEPIYVTVRPQPFLWEDKARAKRVVDEFVPEAASVDLDDEKKERMKWLHESGCGIAQESLFQSAMVTLPDETFEQVRLHPSTTEMHFGLGLALRNRFVHSGLLWSGGNPDNQSSGATLRLIKYCIPEFRDYDLVYDQLGAGALYKAYRYCMEVRSSFPKKEFTEHYGILKEAEQIDDSNPYSILDDEHRDEWRAWSNNAQEKREQYKLATLHEIWNLDAIRNDLGDTAAEECEKLCLAALHDGRESFMPSEIAYAVSGSIEERGMRAFTWAVQDYDVAVHLPDKLFESRNLVLEAVNRRGRLLERAKSYQDDDELVGLAIDANGANIAYASERIRSDFNWAIRAVSNRRNIYPDASYEDLSDEMKKDKRIALVVAGWDRPPSDFPDFTLADDDDIGAALAQKEDHFALFGMSRRIKEKYMTEEELERWGDDPWWWHGDEEEV